MQEFKPGGQCLLLESLVALQKQDETARAYTVLELRLNLARSFVLGKESTFASIVRRLSIRPYIVLS